jgi:hypothetical protein
MFYGQPHRQCRSAEVPMAGHSRWKQIKPKKAADGATAPPTHA